MRILALVLALVACWSASAAAVGLPALPPIRVQVECAQDGAIPEHARFNHARARAWLKALSQAVLALPGSREFRLAAEGDGQRLALAAHLYAVEDASFDYVGGEKVRLHMVPHPDLASELDQAVRNPELLQLEQAFIAETRSILDDWDVAVKAHGGLASPDLWRGLASHFEGLWLAHGRFILTGEGWMTEAKSINALEAAGREAPNSPVVQLLLAEARLQGNLPQQSIDACTRALEISPQFGRARYIRGLAHFRLQRLALAEDDLDVALGERQGPAPQGEEMVQRLRARGAVRMVRGNHAGMCEDFTRACALGDCEGLSVARKQGRCREARP